MRVYKTIIMHGECKLVTPESNSIQVLTKVCYKDQKVL